MALQLQYTDQPLPPRNEYDDAVDYLQESKTGWASVSLKSEDVRKTKKGLNAAAARQGKKLKYESRELSEGRVELFITERPETVEEDAPEAE